MATQEGTQSRSQSIVSWPLDVSHHMLELCVTQHKSGKGGDNGLRNEIWLDIAKKLNEKYGMTYDWKQCRNHFKIWKARFKTLSDLQKNSGMGWNAQENRFNAGQHVWSEFKKKEQRYWKEHRVLPIHLEVAIWLGNEVASGVDSIHAADVAYDEDQELPFQEMTFDNIDLETEDMEVEGKGNSTLNQSTSRSHKMASTSGKRQSHSRKKKAGVDKIASLLKMIAKVISILLTKESDLATELHEVIDAIPGIDFEKQIVIKEFLVDKKDKANLFLTAPIEKRPQMIEYYLRLIREQGNFI
ncbi:uncharacterized protein LOC122644861 [Telopea speciosissima]|uniref:uncharacterized protein LOC122644861 n=1 Tax=Telopea speciosissima TaxID=54955 RepID=UPI001CC587EA|nr:uncharacterized protein LOC122644861 [Telopea speciosissima]